MTGVPIPIRHIAGPVPGSVPGGLVLLHGRGSNAVGMTSLAKVVADGTMPVLAPDAPAGSWYPNRFLVDVALNQPALSRALDAVGAAIEAFESRGVPASSLVVAGFSQGACLALEFAARFPRRYGAVVALAGALIGPAPEQGGYAGDLEGSPILLASGDVDQHVPVDFVLRSADVLRGMGADVRSEIHAGMGHAIHPVDLRTFRDLVVSARDRATSPPAGP